MKVEILAMVFLVGYSVDAAAPKSAILFRTLATVAHKSLVANPREKELQLWVRMLKNPKNDFSVLNLDYYEGRSGYLVSTQKKMIELSSQELQHIIEQARPSLAALESRLHTHRMFLDCLCARLIKKTPIARCKGRG